MSDNYTPQDIDRITTILVLQDQVKNLTTLKEFGFFTTNETHRILHFDVSYLWQKWEFFDIRLLAQSESPEIDAQTPKSQWVRTLIKSILNSAHSREIQVFEFKKPRSEPESENSKEKEVIEKSLLETWPKSIPTNVLWSPFIGSSDDITGGLILFRSSPFVEHEIKMYGWLARNYQYTWRFLSTRKLISFYNIFKKRRSSLIVSLVVAALLLFPIRQSVTATAIVIPKQPALINSPIQGMISDFFVKPGEEVKRGQKLIALDKKDFLGLIEINQKKILLAEAKVRSADNQAYNKPEVRSEIPILEAELAVDRAELEYSKLLLSKTDISSPIDGVADFESRENWIGQPVEPGENIMTVADPNQVQLKIQLPITELLDFKVGSEGKFYLYGEFSEIPIRLTTLGYNAELTPNKILAYRYLADFVDPSVKPRLGNQGNVRLYGSYVPLIYFLLKKPIQAVRHLFGI